MKGCWNSPNRDLSVSVQMFLKAVYDCITFIDLCMLKHLCLWNETKFVMMNDLNLLNLTNKNSI